MAKQISIPITDHDSNCSQYYTIEYKLTTDAAYTTLTQFVPPLIINNVLDSATYDVRVSRMCCNNVLSNVTTTTVDTTTISPTLVAPANFTLVPGGSSGELDADWDAVTDAEGYYGILSTTSDFSSIAYYFNTVDPLTAVTIPGLLSGTLYYGKVRAAASGYTDSPYSNVDSATAT